mgnify:CR=1 FL=1
MTVNFSVTMDVDDMEGNVVLVYLIPQNPPPYNNDIFHPWQVLAASAGSTEYFNFEPTISADVTSVSDGNTIVSERMSVQPGELLAAISPDGLSPMLQLAQPQLAQENVTPEQCGIIDQTDPFIQFKCNWYVNDKPVLTTLVGAAYEKIRTFEYTPNFFGFIVASPPLGSLSHAEQDFSTIVGQQVSPTIKFFMPMTNYTMPATATDVAVTLTKVQGQWTFSFNAS